MVEALKQIVGTVGDNLKGQPLAFGLLLINIIFLGSLIYVMQERSESNERKDALITQLLEKCK
jgi:hypothetical protein